MLRPFFHSTIGQLEELFAKSKNDCKALRQLEDELQHRQVPRAVSLLEEVKAATKKFASAARVPTSQLGPVELTLPAGPGAPPTVNESIPLFPPQSIASGERAEKPAIAKRPPSCTVSLDDAYKLLKATAGSTWESIEQTRRQLVRVAHPERLRSMSPDQRAQALVDAKCVNDAYAMLSQARCGVSKPLG